MFKKKLVTINALQEVKSLNKQYVYQMLYSEVCQAKGTSFHFPVSIDFLNPLGTSIISTITNITKHR